jgi:hypothetical protein
MRAPRGDVGGNTPESLIADRLLPERRTRQLQIREPAFGGQLVGFARSLFNISTPFVLFGLSSIDRS